MSALHVLPIMFMLSVTAAHDIQLPQIKIGQLAGEVAARICRKKEEQKASKWSKSRSLSTESVYEVYYKMTAKTEAHMSLHTYMYILFIFFLHISLREHVPIVGCVCVWYTHCISGGVRRDVALSLCSLLQITCSVYATHTRKYMTLYVSVCGSVCVSDV